MFPYLSSKGDIIYKANAVPIVMPIFSVTRAINMTNIPNPALDSMEANAAFSVITIPFPAIGAP